ncbi:hypothetical protein GDO86_002599, partial [Hymenochirus boettgeri]
LQTQYHECQELLGLYQTYLSEQQKKLHESPIKTEQVPIVPQQRSASNMNGSYLPHSCHGPCCEASSSCSYGTNRPYRRETACKLTFHGDPCESSIANPAQRKYSSTGLRGYHVHQCRPQCCLHSMPENTHSTPRRNTPDSSPRNTPQNCFARNSELSAPTNELEMGPGKTYGNAVSEERKHELLLQKLELEIEKERLQQLLAQQEAKLLAKQQQLQQPRLRYNRSPQISDIPPHVINNVTRPSSDPLPMSTSLRYSPARSLNGITTSPPSRVTPKQQSAGNKLIQKSSQQQDPLRPDGRNSLIRGPKIDAATSPCTAFQKADPMAKMTSPGQRRICRYETSLLDMLDTVSPISTERPRPHWRDTYDFSILGPVLRNHPTSFIKDMNIQQPTEEPQESQMLEDIFFIC